MGYLSSADLLPSLQSGFRQGHSTETAVLRVLSDILQAGRYSEHLESCELQFGFSPKRWAAMCTMMLKETVSYYVKNSSNVYCTFLDATKAFDRVEYCKLFKLLMDRDMPVHVIRVLLNLYTGQQVRVLWNVIYCRSGEKL